MSVIGRRHGEPPCVCTDAGEDPQCPIHGYEAVIRRLREENERLTDDHQGAVAALVRLANPTHRPRSEEAWLLQAEVVQIAQATLDALGGPYVADLYRELAGAVEAARKVLRDHQITDLEDGGVVYVDALALAELRDAVRRIGGQ